LKINEYKEQLKGYDACFFCAGISSVGLKEKEYTVITYDTSMIFAKTLLEVNPNIVFNYVSGRSTDSTEKGNVMWARVKGKTENDLMKLGFKAQYNFRPALMLPFDGQKSVKPIFKLMANILKYIMPKATLTLSQVGQAMINVVENGYSKQILEVNDIRIAANETNK